MRIDIVSPVPNSSTRGNGVTARRWGGILEGLGHNVVITNSFDNALSPNTDCVIGIHATRSSAILQAVKETTPNVAIVVCLSGTDLHRDLAKEERDEDYQRAARCLAIADRVILLEPEGAKTIRNSSLRDQVDQKSTVIFQSAVAVPKTEKKLTDVFEVSVIGHLRSVKDPFRTAYAVELLSSESRIQVVHFGQALSDSMCEQAIALDKANPRYRWVGNRPHTEAMRLLARSRATVLSSISEGAPSLISEAVVNGVPILATQIPATIGLLGDDYPGFFEVSDTQRLAELLQRLEAEPSFGEELRQWLRRIEKRFDPQHEIQAWSDLLSELV